MTTFEAPAIPAATHGKLLESFRLPDVSAFDIESLPIDAQVEMHEALKGALIYAAARFAELTRPIAEAKAQLSAQILTEMARTGGSKLPHDTFDVIRNQPQERVKRMDVLVQLRNLLPDDEFAKAFSQKVSINANLDDAMIAQLREMLPGVKIEVKFDADGAALNRLAGKHGYGHDSEIGKIIAEGYVHVDKGPAQLVITPKESALKRVGNAA